MAKDGQQKQPVVAICLEPQCQSIGMTSKKNPSNTVASNVCPASNLNSTLEWIKKNLNQQGFGPIFNTFTQKITMTKELIREAFWQSTQAFIEAEKNGVAYTDWHPVFGIL